MTDQEINIAIAEVRGWKMGVTVRPGYAGRIWLQPDAEGPMPERSSLPDYCHDLNAMNEAEEQLSPRERGDYHFWILDNDDTNARQFVPGACPSACELWYLTHATARQRAEAFLRTKGMWKE